MRPQKVDDQQLMTGLMAVLRAKGFDGASMNDLSEATGLKKASLYHRFPGGKKEIAEAVLAYTGDWSEVNIYQVLTDQTKPPLERLQKVIANIRVLYNDGQAICILRALTMDSSLPLFGNLIEERFKVWIEAFVLVGKDFGFTDEKAQKLALETLVRVQGSLVLSKALDNVAPFQENLMEIERIYTT